MINFAAPFWNGDTAERQLKQRLEDYATSRKVRAPRNGVRKSTPERELTRLRRALRRRKTEAGIARTQARIAELEAKLK